MSDHEFIANSINHLTGRMCQYLYEILLELIEINKNLKGIAISIPDEIHAEVDINGNPSIDNG